MLHQLLHLHRCVSGRWSSHGANIPHETTISQLFFEFVTFPEFNKHFIPFGSTWTNTPLEAGIRSDFSFGPDTTCDVTIVGYFQAWGGDGGLDSKAKAWMRVPSVTYILCVKASEDLECWTYKLYEKGVAGWDSAPIEEVDFSKGACTLSLSVSKLYGDQQVPQSWQQGDVVINLSKIRNRVQRINPSIYSCKRL
jgi:hypothetical protein